MDLHLNYETIPPYPLERVDVGADLRIRLSGDEHHISSTSPSNVGADGVRPSYGQHPSLGAYSALEWVLERYKKKKPKDPTIAAQFNTYHFADYKESVIDLLGRVCAVSVKTMEIIKEMPD